MRDERQSSLDIFAIGDRAVARRSDPETSHEAADSVSRQSIRETQRRIMGILAGYGACSDEKIAAAWKWSKVSPSGLRTRRSELVARDLVEHVGFTVNRAGNRTRTWGLTQAGWDALPSPPDD